MSISSPLRICLYVAVPPEAEYRRLPMSASLRAKAAMGRGLDVVSWLLRANTHVRFHHWHTHEVTNKGDIAIREAVKQQLAALFAPRAVTFTTLGWGMLDAENAARIGSTHDLFVIAGSGYVSAPDDGELHPRYEADRQALAHMACRKISYGIGWNKLLTGTGMEEMRPLTQRSRQTLAGIFAGLDFVSVRDETTHALVKDVTGRPPHLTGDPALFYRGAGSPAKKARSGKLRVGLNIALHGNASAARVGGQLDAICVFLRAFAGQHDVVYHYVQHSHTERILPLMLRSRGVPVKRVDILPEQLPAFYATLDLHLCQMLHSAILCLDAGVPTVHFAYDVKSFGFFDLMQMPQYCLPSDPFDPQRALATARDLLADADAVRAHIARRKAEIWAAGETFRNEIKALV